MHTIFSVSLFTGQQLVLEAIQRWLQRPCNDADAHRQRRLGLKGAVALLLRTAATGALASLLDAAIEFRRRQLLAAAAAPEPDEAAAPGTSCFPGLGLLSRAGVAAWKSRLLLCVDELERRAEAYGIESRHRYSKDDNAGAGGSSDGKAAASPRIPLRGQAGSSVDLLLSNPDAGAEERSQRLGRTVEQLRELVKPGDAESERRLDEEVGSLVDLLLGTVPLTGSAAATSAPACRRLIASTSLPAALDRLGSSGVRAARAAADGVWAQEPPSSPGSSSCPSPSAASDTSATGPELCQICMDRTVRMQVAGCRHDLCFTCARRLCATEDHLVPQCPFCRQAINGFEPISAATITTSAATNCA